MQIGIKQQALVALGLIASAFGAASARADTTVYTDRAAWEAAAAGAKGALVFSDNFDSGTGGLGGIDRDGLVISGTAQNAFPNGNVQTTIDGTGYVRVLLGDQGGADSHTTFTFGAPVFALGYEVNPQNFNLGASVAIAVDGTAAGAYALPVSDVTEFRGFVSDVPFRAFEVRSPEFVSAWHGIDNLRAYVQPAPRITSGPTVTDLTSGSATVQWSTDRPGDSTVSARPEVGDCAKWVRDAAVTTNHIVFLTGLTPATTHTYEVRTVDALGLVANSAPATFLTDVRPDNLTFDGVRGVFEDVAKPGGDSVTLKSGYAVTGQADLGFDPATMDAHLWIEVGGGTALDVQIPAGDAGWKVKRNGFRWKSAKGTFPRVNLVVSTSRQTVSLRVSGYETPVPAASDVLFGFELGDDRGLLTGSWTESKAGRFQSP